MKTIRKDGITYKVEEANGVRYYRGYDHFEGGIYMVEPKTIDRYRELKAEQPKSENYGVFFAFDKEQFKEGYNILVHRGFINEGDKICEGIAGMYGTRSEIGRYMDFYKEREAMMKAECNPQEVYFYEWNNHECMFTNDDDAMKVVISIFGKEVAHTIHRVYEGTPTNILAPLNERDKHLGEYEHELMMLGRMKSDMRGFFSEGDCRYHRPADLWAGNINGQIHKMRELYAKLPDDIKDAACMTQEEINDYCKRLEEWGTDEFNKSKYDPVPATPYDTYHGLEIEVSEKLYFKDDDGTWQTPYYVWFSCDSRRWHQDASQVHGRAMTMYNGALRPVYISSSRFLGFEPYRRDDLCDVTCKYEYKPLHGRLYDFHHE